MARLLARETCARWTPIRGARTHLSRGAVHPIRSAHRQVPGPHGPVTDLVSSAVNCGPLATRLLRRRDQHLGFEAKHPGHRMETLLSTRGKEVVVLKNTGGKRGTRLGGRGRRGSTQLPGSPARKVAPKSDNQLTYQVYTIKYKFFIVLLLRCDQYPHVSQNYHLLILT
jgi:hypothetical protein